MVVKVGMPGVIIKNQGGEWLFYPQYDPAKDEAALAVPLGDGSYYLVDATDAATLATNDKTPAIPIQGGRFASPNTVRALPFQVSSGVSEKTVSTGYTQSLGRFVFYWDGSQDLYLSGSSSGVTNMQINDGITVKSPRKSGYYRVDPSFDDYLRITSISGLVREGVNVIEVILENNYGTTISASSIYLYQGST